MSAKRKSSAAALDQPDAAASKRSRKVSADAAMMPPPPKKKRASQQAGSNELDLYDLVTSSTAASSAPVDAWRAVHSKSARDGLLSLLNFVLASAGSDSRVTLSDVDGLLGDADATAIVERLGDARGERSYPLLDKARSARQFRGQFVNLWQRLVRGGDAQLDRALFDALVPFLLALSQSLVRALRHTAALAALALHGAFVEHSGSLRSLVAANQRALSAEKRKGDRTQGRVTELSREGDSLRDAAAHCQDYLSELYEGAFAHRYKDVDAMIRTETLDALAQWALADPEHYADDVHTRHFGWSLSDRSEHVRASAVRALTQLYAVEAVAPRLERFTLAFRSRMVQLLEDRNPSVVVAAYPLLTELAAQSRLEPDHIEAACALIHDADPRIRLAAATFVRVHVLERTVANEESAKVAALKGKKALSARDSDQRVHSAQLRSLVSLLQKTSAPLPEFLVHSLGSLPALLDWECLVALLGAASPIAHDESQLSLVAQLTLASVRRCAGDALVPLSAAMAAPVGDDEAVVALTRTLSQALPELLATHSSSGASVLAPLAAVPKFFALDVFAQLGLEESLTGVLRSLLDTAESSVEPSVLDAASSSLCSLSTRTHAQERECTAALDASLAGLVQRARDLARQLRLSSSSSSSASAKERAKVEVEVTTALRRVVCFGRHVDTSAHAAVRSSEWLTELDKLLQHDEEGHALTPALLEAQLDSAQVALMWQRSALTADSAEAELRALAHASSAHLAHLERLIEHDHTHVRAHAFHSLSDLLVVFSPALRTQRTRLATLAFTPSPTLVAKILEYFNAEMRALPEHNEEQQELEDQEGEDDQEQQGLGGSVRARELIGCLGRLVLYECLGGVREAAPHVLRYYTRHGALVKAFHAKLREVLPLDFGVVFDTLRTLYEDDGDLVALQTLAQRIAASYGLTRARSEDMRRSLANLLCECIRWSAHNVLPRQMFLRYAGEPLVQRLDEAVAARVLEYYREQMQGVNLQDPAAAVLYGHLATFLKRLQHVAREEGAEAPGPIETAVAPAEPEPHRHSSARLQQRGQEGEGEEGEHEEIEEEEEGAGEEGLRVGGRSKRPASEALSQSPEPPRKKAKVSSTPVLALGKGVASPAPTSRSKKRSAPSEPEAEEEGASRHKRARGADKDKDKEGEGEGAASERPQRRRSSRGDR